MKVALIGSGKMGLPIACRFAQRGAEVFCCDANAALVEMIQAGRSPVAEPGVEEIIRETRAAGRLQATTDTASAVAQCETVVIIVPALLTPDSHADLTILTSVTRTVASSMKPGTLVIYETTIPVGTTRNVFEPLLAESGKPFLVAFSPERVKSNHVMEKLGVTPKVVGGLTPEAGARAEEFYREFLGAPVSRVSSPESAELVKLAGMLYRDVNIALSNQIARYAETLGVDYPSLIADINSDGEAALLQPGIGVGGHCTPVYPYFLIHSAAERGVPMTLAEDARKINDGQAVHIVDRLEKTLGSLRGREVMILGLGFRPGVKEHICSPAFLLREALRSTGAQITLVDPLYSDDEIQRHGFTPGNLSGALSQRLASSACGMSEGIDPSFQPDSGRAPLAIMLNTAHPAFQSLDFSALHENGLEAVVDGRNFWNPGEVREAGLLYLGIGRPTSARV